MPGRVRVTVAGILAVWGIAATAQANEPTPSAVSRQVDKLLAEEVFADSKDTLAPRTSDAQFLRRVTLDAIGQLPTPDEQRLFAMNASADKRRATIERLLADERYGVNWARYWRDVIFYRRIEDRALLAAGAAENYLTEQFNENVAWDELARSFIAATGNVVDEGSTALIMAQGADNNDVASEVSRIFMGVQIQCAQCHDHPTDRWKRQQFHEFAAFFPRVMLRPVRTEDGQRRGFEVASRDSELMRRRGNQPGRGSLEHYMPDLKDPASQGTLTAPLFFANGRSLPTGTKDLDRRETIADWITSPDNEWFAKAFVNRMWSELVGEGFYEPIDDLGPDRTPTAPRTLDYLAADFVANGYDVKRLVETIMLTDAYQRTSRERRTANETPFAANVAQPLRSDQTLDLLLSATGMELPTNTQRGPGRGFATPRNLFAVVFGFDPSDRRGDISPTIAQALVLMNSPQMNRVLDGHTSRTTLGRLLNDEPNDRQALRQLYLRTLAREPNDHELQISLAYIQASDDRAAAYEDLLWTLINRTEFALRN